MDLQDRDLSHGTKGDDVHILQSKLRQLGFTIPDQETDERLFGEATHAAEALFQKKQGLEPTGAVDKRTARLISAEVNALQPQKLIVSGFISLKDGSPLAEAVVQAFDKAHPTI